MSKKTKATKKAATKSHREPTTISAAAPDALEPTAAPEPKSLVVEDYADQPKVEQSATEPTAPVVNTVPDTLPENHVLVPLTDPQPTAPAKVERPSKSTVEKPTKAVWTIADEMKAADPNVTRKAIVDECVRRGIAYYTARTQAQLWSKKRG